MTHPPIFIDNVSLSLPHKVCFDTFNTTIYPGNRIAIIGVNGAGKSTLLNFFTGNTKPTDGRVKIQENLCIGYVPQIITNLESLSGGQRFNSALTRALSLNLDLLLLDEPTNHLDVKNRKSLLGMLRGYRGTLIFVTHDVELLRVADILWHIDQGKIHVFQGDYDDYIREKNRKRSAIECELNRLNQQKQAIHQSLMFEQKRAKTSSAKGEKNIKQRKWPTIVSGAKARRAEETSGHKKSAIHNERLDLMDKLADLRLPEVIVPTFSLKPNDINSCMLVSITDGYVGYALDKPILSNIHLSLMSTDRLAITGDNGSGKSTLIKGILNDSALFTSGVWLMPERAEIGYLDQQYATLDSTKTVFETIHQLMPNPTHAEIRKHLNDFLFRKNEEVNLPVAKLSGGERVRLSLAQIGAKTPRLLILDEVTNNLDLETRNHVIEVLRLYPGAIIVISHDKDFLDQIGVRDVCDVHKNLPL